MSNDLPSVIALIRRVGIYKGSNVKFAYARGSWPGGPTGPAKIAFRDALAARAIGSTAPTELGHAVPMPAVTVRVTTVNDATSSAAKDGRSRVECSYTRRFICCPTDRRARRVCDVRNRQGPWTNRRGLGVSTRQDDGAWQVICRVPAAADIRVMVTAIGAGAVRGSGTVVSTVVIESNNSAGQCDRNRTSPCMLGRTKSGVLGIEEG